MILSHDDIKESAKCLDCTRRTIDVTLCADFGALHDAIDDQFGICLGDLEDDIAHGAPFNLVVVEHDKGCPRVTLRYGLPSSNRHRSAEMLVVSVDLPDDHPWVLARQQA